MDNPYNCEVSDSEDQAEATRTSITHVRRSQTRSSYPYYQQLHYTQARPTKGDKVPQSGIPKPDPPPHPAFNTTKAS
ncbi:hypothetical protein OG21DRAFT_1512929 [Imleria badia]|nr:hypothetical protein OG21DRAFT_1512929 [Imleria badia]